MSGNNSLRLLGVRFVSDSAVVLFSLICIIHPKGKTTLIQHILRSPDHGKRIAVIENEFGGGRDGLAIESLIARDGLNNDPNNSLQDLIELPNGCVCCTVKDSLVVTLEQLLQRRPDIDTILIECSGLANPGPIASIFWLDSALQSRLRLDGIVTLVNAAQIDRQLHETYEAAQQIAYADRILLNHSDRLLDNEASLEAVQARIRRMTSAPLQVTTFANVPDLDWILSTREFDPAAAACVPLTPSMDNSPDDGDHHHHHHHSHSHDHGDDPSSCSTCQHTQFVSTITLHRSEAVDLDQVHRWLAQVLWPAQDERTTVIMEQIRANNVQQQQHTSAASSSTEQDIYRIKGVLLAREDVERPHIVQAVHDVWDIDPAHSRWTSEPCCKVIVIGRHLNEEELRRGFNRC